MRQFFFVKTVCMNVQGTSKQVKKSSFLFTDNWDILQGDLYRKLNVYNWNLAGTI